MFSLDKLKNKLNEKCDFSDIVLLLSLIFIGGFNDYISCLISIVLLIHLFLKIRKNNAFIIRINPLFISIFTLVFFYGITVFWAIDSGMAFIGFFKYLPLLIYLSVLHQSEKNKKPFEILPYFTAILVIISSVFSFIPFTKDLFLVSERLSGFFQYPNTFAILILICELLIFKKNKLKIIDYITLFVLIGGLLYTGSRTVFLLFIASNFLIVLIKVSKKKRILIFGIASFIAILLLTTAFFGPSGNILSRYLKIGFTQSTFVGRLLYMFDALPLIFKYPFGMGYFGYHYIQGSIQTGVYNVSYVHNDIMQIALDIGIIPMILFIASIIYFLFKKKVSLTDKLIIAVFTLHNMFDFNLQFIGMFILYLLLLNENDGKQITITNIIPFKIILPIIAVINLYMSVPLALSQFTAYETADKLFPFNTRNKLLLLEEQEDIETANEIADEILLYNTYYYAPYSIKAKYCYSKGDFLGVIENKNQVFLKNRFRYTEYKEYGIMLANGIIAYGQMGDSNSSDILKKELLSLKKIMEQNENHISKLGSMIDEKPITVLPDDILSYINYSSKETGDLN